MRNNSARQTVTRRFKSGAAAVAALAVLGMGSAFADEIVIGASLPLSGPLAGFGSFQQWGYKRAVDEVNKAGGITVDGKKKTGQAHHPRRQDRPERHRVEHGDADLARPGRRDAGFLHARARQRRRAGRRTREEADGDWLRSARALPVGAQVELRLGHFLQRARTCGGAVQGAGQERNSAKTNKKIALWHDNGPDGQAVGGHIWPDLAKQFGYEVVQNAEFPVDNTQFTSIIGEAKAKGADVVLVDAITPQAIAVRKQMAAGGLYAKGPEYREGRRAGAVRRGARQAVRRRAWSAATGIRLSPIRARPISPKRSRARPNCRVQPAHRRFLCGRAGACSTRSQPPAPPIQRRSTPRSPRPTRPMSSVRSSSPRTILRCCRSSRCNGRAAKRSSSGRRIARPAIFLFPLP